MNNRTNNTKPDEVVLAFFDTLNNSGPDAAAEYLDDDYTNQSPSSPPLTKEQWVASHHMMHAGFPDMHEEFEVICVEGNQVHGINHTTGTHTANFDLSPMGIGVIPATGKPVFAVNSVTHVVEGGKLKSSTAKPVANLGFEWVLAQLGIEVPQ